MAKYCEKLGRQIAEAIEKDNFTVGEVCEMHAISRKTFYKWMQANPDFAEMVEEAKLSRDSRLAQKARAALQKRLEEGYSVTVTKYKYAADDMGELYLKEKTVTVREYAADMQTIKLAMEKDSPAKANKAAKGEETAYPLIPALVVKTQEQADELKLFDKNVRTGRYGFALQKRE